MVDGPRPADRMESREYPTRRPAASEPTSSSATASRRLASTRPAAGCSPRRSAECFSATWKPGCGSRNRFQAWGAAFSSAPTASGRVFTSKSGLALLDAETWQELGRIDQPFTPEAVTISPDGKLIASQYGRTIEILDAINRVSAGRIAMREEILGNVVQPRFANALYRHRHAAADAPGAHAAHRGSRRGDLPAPHPQPDRRRNGRNTSATSPTETTCENQTTVIG